jgi:hypothetical protein
MFVTDGNRSADFTAHDCCFTIQNAPVITLTLVLGWLPDLPLDRITRGVSEEAHGLLFYHYHLPCISIHLPPLSPSEFCPVH